MAFWTTVLVSAAIASIAALGLFLQIRSGQLNVGMAVFVGVGGYVSGALGAQEELPPLATIPLAVAAGALFGAAFSAVTLRLHHWFFAVTTLTLAIAAVSAIGRIPALGGPLGLSGIPLMDAALPAILGLAGCFVLVVLFDRSRFGLAMRATGDDSALAGMFGVRVRRLRIAVFALGSAMGALSGALTAHRFGLYQPTDLGVAPSLLLFVYVIVGGKSHVAGPLLGTFFLFTVPELVPMPPEAQLLAFGGVMALVSVACPGGLAQALSDGFGRLVPGKKRRKGMPARGAGGLANNQGKETG